MFRRLQQILFPVFYRNTGLRLLAAMIVSLCTLTPSPAADTQEYDLKAAFLYNFATFTEWPAEAFEKADSPFVIGILGDDPFGRILSDIIKGETVGNHRMVIEHFKRPEDLSRCHILFIGDSEARKVTDVLRRLRGQPVLTVSDIPNFAEAGGAIGFVTTTSIGLEINPAATQGSNLVISSKLLRLAKLVSVSSPLP